MYLPYFEVFDNCVVSVIGDAGALRFTNGKQLGIARTEDVL